MSMRWMVATFLVTLPVFAADKPKPAPLTPDQFTACKGCVQIPWALSATSIIYNLDGVKNLLHMDGPTLAKERCSSNDRATKRSPPGRARMGRATSPGMR